VPLLDIFWTFLVIAAFALGIWLLYVVLRDVFERDDLSTGAKVGWTLLACLLPLLGSLTYLVTRRASAGELQIGSAARRRRAAIYE
jgi:hypothetical protein